MVLKGVIILKDFYNKLLGGKKKQIQNAMCSMIYRYRETETETDRNTEKPENVYNEIIARW